MSFTPHLHLLDLAVILVFLAVNVVVGFWHRGRSQTFTEYAVGDKKFATPVLTATIVATWMSGSLFFLAIENTYSRGLYYSIACVAGVLTFLLLTGLVIGPRMGKFIENISVPHILGTYYGPRVQAITGISIVLTNVGYIAMQFQVISRIIAMLFSYHGIEITIVTASLVIFYSASGGVKSVTFTDVVQFFTFGSLIPLLALAVWNRMETPPLQVSSVLNHNPLFSFRKVFQWTPEFRAMLVLMSYLMMPSLPSPLFQRMAMAKNVKQIRDSFIWAAAVCLAIELGIMWIAILILADNPSLKQEALVPYLVNNYTYPGLKGLFGTGLVALAMSTADSVLNSCGVVVANDIVPYFRPKHKVSVSIARVATFSLGFTALVLSLQLKDMLKTILLSASFYSPIVVMPTLLTIFGFKTSRRVVLMAMGAGGVTVVSCWAYFQSVNSFFPGMLANLAVMLGAHYGLGEEGGWGHNPLPASSGSVSRDPSPWWKSLASLFQRLEPTAYLKRLLPQQEALYPILGFYILSVTYASLYLLHPAIRQAYPEAYDLIQYSILGLSSTLLMYLIWPPALREKRLLAWGWPIVVFYALFLVGGNLALVSGFNVIHLFLFMLNLNIAVLFFPWRVILGMLVGTLVLNWLFFIYYMEGYMMLGDQSTTHFKVIYGFLLASSALMALFKHRQSYEELETYNRALSQAQARTEANLLENFKEKVGLLQTLAQAGIDKLPQMAKMTRELHKQGQEPLAKRPELLKKLEALEEHLVPMALSLDRIESRVMEYLRLQIYRIPLRPLVSEVERILEPQRLHHNLHFHLKTEHGVLTCDAQRVVTVLVNAITMLRHEIGEEPAIHVAVRSAKLTYAIKSVREDYTKVVDAVRFVITTSDVLPKADLVYAGQTTREPLPVAETSQALLPITNQRIIRAHYGHSVQEVGNYQYVIPVDIKELRTPDMDRSYMDIGAELVRSDDQYPGAQEQEQAFLDSVELRTTADLKRVRTALEMIKWYHGSMKRKTGEPFYLHPLSVAQIVLDYNQDEATILGALLHDTVEDTPMLIENIETAFGTEVMGIVAGVTHLESYGGGFQKVKLSADENIMMLLGLADERALYVKVADRMHNMRTIHGKERHKQVATAQETLRFYVPLAEKIGLHMAAEGLKKMCADVLQSGKE